MTRSTVHSSSSFPTVPTLRLVVGKPYRILSVIQPWAWAIIFAGKDVENRSWNTRYRGQLLIHASAKRLSKVHMAEDRQRLARWAGVSLDDVPEEFGHSQILGSVELMDCREHVRSRWAQKDYKNWCVERPRRLAKPIEDVHGSLGVWTWNS